MSRWKDNEDAGDQEAFERAEASASARESTPSGGTRMSRHNRMRAERFAAQGIVAADLRVADTSYEGDGDTQCVLCDTGIVHQFQLTFSKADGPVTFFPVGSKCITDYMKALPESPEREAAIERVRGAEREMRRQRDVIARMEEEGDADGAALMRIFCRLPRDVRKGDPSNPMVDIGAKVLRYGSFASQPQRRLFAVRVREAARAAGIPTGELVENQARAAAFGPAGDPPAPAPAGEDPRLRRIANAEERDLAGRYLVLTPAQKSGLRDQDRDALDDMGGRLLRYGSFRTDAQRRYFSGLVGRAERAAGGPRPPTPPRGVPRPQAPAPAPAQGTLFSAPPPVSQAPDADERAGVAPAPDCAVCGCFMTPETNGDGVAVWRCSNAPECNGPEKPREAATRLPRGRPRALPATGPDGRHPNEDRNSAGVGYEDPF
jgi:hypothetical protein